MMERRDRPEWVDQVIRDIDNLTQHALLAASVLIQEDQRIVKISAGPTSVIQHLDEAMHDLAHVFEHVEGVRRGLIMAWPSNNDDPATGSKERNTK